MRWHGLEPKLRGGPTGILEEPLSDPLVAVLVPVYNGSATLHDCIASVLAQSYPDWVLFVVDNASTDDSVAIAQRAARSDPRVHVVACEDHVGMLHNWNRAMACAPAEAVYIKQLNVDDRLRPPHLERLVAVAESIPEAGVVSAYFTYGDEQVPRRTTDTVEVVSGRESVRRALLGEPGELVHPSAMLLRREAVPGWPSLFQADGFPPGHPIDPPLTLADKEAYFGVLEKFDLAFVPEVLTDIRKHDESATGYSARVGAWHPSRLEAILRHGDRFLDAAERKRALRRSSRKYLLSLVWRLLKGTAQRDADFAEYQRLALAHLLPRLEREAIGFATRGLRHLQRYEALGAG